MKRPLQISLLILTGIVAIALVFWMRSLASWRPVKLGVLPWPHLPQHISKDERFVLTTDAISSQAYNFSSFDLVRGKSDKLPAIGSLKGQAISQIWWTEPFYWYVRSSKESDPLTLELHDPHTRRIEHSFHWRNWEDTNLVGKADNNTFRILNRYAFREFDLASDKMTRTVKLANPFIVLPAEEGEVAEEYAISPDGKRLYGCRGPEGQVWEAHTGKLLRHWKMTPATRVLYYSPDARVLICAPTSTSSSAQYIFLDSATGKTLWTTKDSNLSEASFSLDDSEVVMPQKNNCEVRDTLTGRLLRQLPGPRLSDPYVFQVTHNSIYSLNAKHNVLLWRAR